VLEAAPEHVLVRVSDDRTSAMEMPSERFVALEDRRDSALGWPIVCDVAAAHGGTVHTEARKDAAGAVIGFQVTLKLRSA